MRVVAVLLVVLGCGSSADWRVTGGDPGNSRYSTLDQINTGNVNRLQVAWT